MPRIAFAAPHSRLQGLIMLILSTEVVKILVSDIIQGGLPLQFN